MLSNKPTSEKLVKIQKDPLSFFENIRHIEFGLLYGCNLKCPLCEINYYNVMKINPPVNEDNKRFINFDSLCKFLDKFSNLRTITLCGTVSEPTLYYKIIELCEYIQKIPSKPIIKISTNGNTNKNIWIKLSQILQPKDIVIFGIDGSTQELYQKYRKGGSLKKVLDNHKILKDNPQCGCMTILQFIKFNYNVDDVNDIPNIINLAKENNFNNIDIRNADNPYDLFDDFDKISKDYDIKVRPNKGQQKIYNRLELLYHTETFEDNKLKYSCTSCSSNHIPTSCYINYRGHLYPCYGWFDTINMDKRYTINNQEHHNLIHQDYYNILDKRNDKDSPCKLLCSTKINESKLNSSLKTKRLTLDGQFIKFRQEEKE